ncbi:flagellin, partial [Aeromonas sp. HMWF017]
AAVGITTIFVGASSISISSQSNAQNVLAAVDSMLGVVDGKRAELGAVQNRLDSTIRNQANISENVSAARSRIRDADFAIETANMTKQNILQQAASSVLAQANQRPQSALSLLG